MGDTARSRKTRCVVAALVFPLLLAATGPQYTFSQAANRATQTLTHVFYVGDGSWRACNRASCDRIRYDWGADSATYTLYLRWNITHDAVLAPIVAKLIRTAVRYPAPCRTIACESWSDVPAWDALALLREYQMTGDRGALALAKRAFAFVEDSRAYRIGACPNIPYQIAGGHRGYGLKTLETGSNALKAALLLYGLTHERRYLAAAVREYSSARRYFADWRIPLYTAYVFDDGERCTQLPHRFFASVNGNMIWSGVTLFEVTGSRTYLAQAIATAQAVARYLQDGRGIFTDLQAENDVVEPLVEAMYELAAHHQRFAREWVLLNARAATSARTPDGAFGRFFDGPPPRSPVSIWQSTGGLALEIAAAGLEPNRAVGTRNPWSNARFISHRVTTPPSTIAFYGSGIALIGTMGEHCCEQGHARIFIDGKETFDYTGIWQNKSMTGAVPDTILFSWRWKHVGRHTIRFEPGTPNAKEGGSFLDLRGYYAI